MIEPSGPVPTSSRIARVRIDEETTMFVELSDRVLLGEREVSDQIYNFDGVINAIRGISTSIVDALKAASPTKYSVELGFDISGEPGWLTAFLVRGEGSASLKVKLEWSKGAES